MNRPDRSKVFAQSLLDQRGEDWKFSHYSKAMRREWARLLIMPAMLLVLAFVWDNSLVAAFATGIIFGLALREVRAIKISQLGTKLVALVLDWDKVQELASDDTGA